MAKQYTKCPPEKLISNQERPMSFVDIKVEPLSLIKNIEVGTHLMQ